MAGYGAGGLVGLLTPQANVAAETELAALLDPRVAIIVTRLTSAAPGLRKRLDAYGQQLPARLDDFGPAPLDLVLYACTATGYLDGLAGEARRLEEVARARRVPVISAAQAVLAALRALDARRVGLVSPYPDWLTDAAVAAWQAEGITVGPVERPAAAAAGSHPIYALRPAAISAALGRLRGQPLDALLLAGTGMPSLPVAADAPGEPPVLTSNLCTAWQATALLQGAAPDARSLGRWLAPDAPWRERIRARTAARLTRPEVLAVADG